MTCFEHTLKQWAQNQYGLMIHDHQMSRIHQGIQKLCKTKGLNETSYLKALMAHDKEIVQATTDLCTVQESYFFRDPILFLYLKMTLLPSVIHEKRTNNRRQLNAWSMGCACGEEIYSLAIVLHETLPDLTQWEIKLLATDINESALEKAKQGMYTKSSLRSLNKQMVIDYFDFKAPYYYLKKNLGHMVTFKPMNIANMIKSPYLFDFIFCRNVFIYLQKETLEYALNFFYDSLVEGGLLFVGTADILGNLNHRFELITKNNLLFLKKKKSDKQKHLGTKPPIKNSFSEPNKDSLLKAIPWFMHEKKFLEVLRDADNFLLNFGDNALIHRYKGEALIKLGDLTTAKTHLKKAIQLDSFDAISYFILGLIELDENNKETAANLFQKALYLKKNFTEAAYFLGLIYLQNKEHKKGLKSIKLALKYAQATQDKDSIILGDNQSMAQLIEAMESTISFYQPRK